MASLLEIVAGAAVEVVIFGVAGAVLYRVWHKASFLPQRTHLLPFHKGVLLKGDTFVKVLGSGKHWVMPNQSIVPVDMRPKPIQLAPHDLLTQDGLPVRIALGGDFRVADPTLYICESANSVGALLVSLEHAFPLAVSEFSAGDAFRDPSLLASRIRERIEPRANQLGLELISLDVLTVLPLYTIPSGEHL